MKNNIDRYQQNNAEYQKLIAQFAQELKNQNTTPLRFFKRADANSNKVLTTEELKDASKELQIPTMNYIKLMKAFDANGNGIVEQREFVELIENATDGAGASNPPAPSNARDRGAASQPRNLGNQDAAPKVAVLNLVDTVNPKDRVNAAQSIEYMKELLACEKRVAGPSDDIATIFDKITAWKQKAGDLDAQEKMVAKVLKPKEDLKIHNMKTVLIKLNELAEPIGLSKDEISIIAYTSIDRDWFTNLIILQGEFLKWFNLNFVGESREELDFVDSKQSQWMSITTQA